MTRASSRSRRISTRVNANRLPFLSMIPYNTNRVVSLRVINHVSQRPKLTLMIIFSPPLQVFMNVTCISTETPE